MMFLLFKLQRLRYPTELRRRIARRIKAKREEMRWWVGILCAYAPRPKMLVYLL